MMPRSNNERAYDVGYKKPPQHTRFKKGQSGNPRGRKKKKPTMPDVEASLAYALNETVLVNVNGTPRLMRKIDVIMGQAVNKAAAGNLGPLRLLLPLAEKYSQMAKANAPEQRNEHDREEIERDLDRLLNMLSSDPGKKRGSVPPQQPSSELQLDIADEAFGRPAGSSSG